MKNKKDKSQQDYPQIDASFLNQVVFILLFVFFHTSSVLELVHTSFQPYNKV